MSAARYSQCFCSFQTTSEHWFIQRVQVHAHQASTAAYTALAKATSRTTTMTIAEATARVAIATRARPASKLAATDILSAACQTDVSMTPT
ncbi:uncharacterized protein LOC142557119 isoform X3 [Dermacentor variabilis]|uniref:uncharacterized protein LOC142557119 isoform X3 n=1 Tax=Dermacentor variabilis TaxID=34621 RepID=UPI003F5BFE29